MNWTVGYRGMAMRVELKGIASATKRLASGRKIKYYYAWRGGPKLDGVPGTPEFVASYNAAVATRRVVPRTTLASLITLFKSSTEFTTDIAERTKLDYLKQITKI